MKNILLMVLLLMSPTLWANDPAEPQGRSVDQAVAKVRQQAAKLDVNKNGVIDEEEKAAKREKLGVMAGYVEKALDSNNDGVVTVAEYISVQEQALRGADINNDGLIDQEEEKKRKKAILREAFMKVGL